MVRPKQFDEQQVLALATDLFWRKGFTNTSLSDLEEHLNVGRKSLYDTFGDKKQLFLKVLDQYLTIPYPIAAKTAAWSEIEAQFHDGPPYDQRYRACLFANTIQEFGLSDDEAVQARIKKHVQRLEKCFLNALRNAVNQNQIPEVNVKLMSKFLTATLHSLSIMAKAGCSKKELRDIADTALKIVRTPD